MIKPIALACLLAANSLGFFYDPEKRFTAEIRTENLKENLRYYTRKAHPAGTQNDHQQALWTKQKFEEFGLETYIQEYEPLITMPLKRLLRMNHPTPFTAALREDVVSEDPESFDQEAVPTFLGYSANGTIHNAQVVYGNYCDPEDFVALEDRDISVRGHIVMCRYGGAFRGLKVRAAELFGAAGVLIYSDPKDDGFSLGNVYPEGPYRPETSVQRGSVQYSNFYSGDPLTPFVAATKDAPRINISDANIPKIPALPISYADARPFLKALIGKGVRASDIASEWQGGLEFQYWTGPAGDVDLEVEHEFKIEPIWNVMAVIPGRREPDRAVVFGNHRDAWVYGAVDPNSGTAVLLETARIFGQLKKEGWRPDRTIVFASWDGEEYGLLGSTEWVEDKVDRINKTVIAYVNIDQGAYGSDFSASATPSLQTLIRDVVKTVKDPFSDKTIYDLWLKRTEKDGETEISPLGFGSDYVPFIHQVGVASMDIRFVGPYGVYHSNYDSFHWMEKIGDVGFKYHTALTEITGKILLRLLGSDILPFDFVPYVKALKEYVEEAESALESSGEEYEIASLHDAVQRFERTIPRTSYSVSLLNMDDFFTEVTLLNDQLGFAERHFLDGNGISGCPWYRHVIYAPGEWTGYGASTCPGIHEAITRGEGIQEAIDQVADSINRVSMFWMSKESWN